MRRWLAVCGALTALVLFGGARPTDAHGLRHRYSPCPAEFEPCAAAFEGGPGYTIQDELSPIPYVRGTLGMALEFKDTGGSQFFITLSPQPHLDGKYTVFGKVVKGLELLDRLSQWDVIERIRIVDGES